MAVRVRFRLSGYECRLAPEWTEWAPQLRVFLDANFRRRPVDFSLEEGASVEGEICGTPKDANGVPSLAAIGFQSSCDTRNHAGTIVRVDTGTDMLFLQSAEPGAKKRIEFRMRTVKNFVKGSVLFEVLSVEMGPHRFVESAIPFLRAGIASRGASEAIMAYIGSTVQMGQRFQDKGTVLSRIRAPVFMGEAGFMLSGEVPLPSAAFVLNETPEMNSEFYLNAWKQVMLRRGAQPSQAGWDALSRYEKAEVVGDIACYVAASLPYETDEVDRNVRGQRYMETLKEGIESFSNAGIFFDGDCEDDGQLIDQTCASVAEEPILEKAPAYMREAVAIAKQYVPVVTLWSVHAASVNDKVSEKLGAHANLVMIPVYEFKQMTERADPRTASVLNWPAEGEMMRGLPIRVCEGTGMFVSRREADPFVEAKKVVYRMGSLGRTKKEMTHVTGEASGFFHVALEGWTSYFHKRGANHIGVIYCSEPGARGVRFEDLEKGNMAALGIAFQPRIPRDTLAFMKEAVKIRTPSHPFVLTEQQPTENAAAEKLVRGVARLGRDAGGATQEAAVYIHSDDFSDKDALDVLAEVEVTPQIVGASYRMEPMMDALAPNIRIAFTVKI